MSSDTSEDTKREKTEPKPERRYSSSGMMANMGAGASTAIKDPGLVLFIIGLLTFYFNESIQNPWLSLFLGSIFLLYTALFIFNGRGLVSVIVFLVWYVFLSGSTAYTAVLWAMLASLVIGIVLKGLFTSITKKGTFLEGGSGEAVAIVPIAIFFIDLGAVEYISGLLHIPLTNMPLAITLLTFTPWWALVGLFTTKKENIIISICKLLAVVYILSMFFVGVAPDLYTGYQQALPGPDALLAAKQELQAQAPKRENPFISYMACALKGEITTTNTCFQQRQETSEFEYACKNVEKLQPDTSAFAKCVQKQRERKEQGLLQVSGISDPTIKLPTKAEIIITDYFPKVSYRQAGAAEPTLLSFPADIKITNPRQQQITVEVSCSFNKTTPKDQVKGKVTPSRLTIVGAEEARTILCEPDSPLPLNGTYKVVYEAKLLNLASTSRLSRAFIQRLQNPGAASKDLLATRETLIRDIMLAHFQGQSHLSLGAADLARINFAFGNPLQSPIVESGQDVALSSSIENVGPGMITSIHSYAILGLDEFTLSGGSESCLRGTITDIPPRGAYAKQIIYLPNCFLTSPTFTELVDPDDYVFKEYNAVVTYDYVLKREADIEVKEVLVGGAS